MTEMTGPRGTTFTIHGGVDAELEATSYRGLINIAIDNPWMGDTESGFGATTRFDLSTEQAIKLADWLYYAASNAGIESPAS